MQGSYRADQVGSLLRPPALRQARAAYAQGRLDREALRQVEDQAILAALDRQRQVGLEVFTDGEYRREFFLSPLLDSVEGIEPGETSLAWRGPAAPASSPAVSGRCGAWPPTRPASCSSTRRARPRPPCPAR